MKQYPIIGIISAKHPGTSVIPLYCTNAHYVEQTAAAGGIPMQLPILAGSTDACLKAQMDICDGFLLPGGGDFDPSWYGETLPANLCPDKASVDFGSQEAAIRMVRMMRESGKPMLGICLGLQVINIAMGGTLIQDIPTQWQTELLHAQPFRTLEERWQLAHPIMTNENTLIRRLCGETISVNSFHHQAIKTVAPGFSVTAFATDGIPEAMESEDGRVLAVQWHPENLSHAGIPEAQRIFRWLVDSAR